MDVQQFVNLYLRCKRAHNITMVDTPFVALVQFHEVAANFAHAPIVRPLYAMGLIPEASA